MRSRPHHSNQSYPRYGSDPHPDITSISLRPTGISIGLEALKLFPNLERLTIEECDLVSLKALKFCPRLRRLIIDGSLNSLDGIELCPLLKTLNCTNSKIESLAHITGCPVLEELICMNIGLTNLEFLQYCPQLRRLFCCHNQLQDLEGIRHCPQLQNLSCGFNQLVSLHELKYCPQLEELTVPYSGLKSLDGIEACPLLRSLRCYNNALATIRPIRQLPLLSNLDCSSNRLVNLEGIENCTRLTYLYICGNQITTLNELVYLRHLVNVLTSNNPLAIQTPQVQRFLRYRKNSNSIYDDRQNVHDPHIQKTVCDSIQRLMSDPSPSFAIETVVQSNLDEHTIRLLLEYCDDKTVHSYHLLTYAELLGYVWARIQRSEHRAELMKILAEQVCDSECKCFTGRFNRLVSVLVGFYPDIVIEISDSSRIGSIILAIKERFNSQGVPYDSVEHINQAKIQLLEAGYTEEEIRPWLEAIA